MKRRPVPGPDQDINIYDLAIMDDAAVRYRVEKMLNRYPALIRIYDIQFVDELIPDRRNLDNHLLLLLADTEDDFAVRFWDEVSADLAALEDAGAFGVFGLKLHQTGRIEVQSAKTELELAAWMRRKGYPVTLEPLNPETGRRCEFAVESVPPTSWEVKSVLDQQTVREQERVRTEVAKHLRYIDEPYILDIDVEGLTLRDVQAAVRYVRQQIREFHGGGGQPFPARFESHGLKVTIQGRSPRDYGYTGTEPIGPYWLGNADIRRVLDRVGDAVAQISRGRAGIVVIDTTMADFVEEEDIEDACYGELIPTFVERRVVQIRRADRIFRPDRNTRISAVMHYERRRPGDAVKRIYHNSFAENKLPPDLLRDSNVKQIRQVPASGGSYRLEEFT